MTEIKIDAKAVEKIGELDAVSALLQQVCDKIAETANSTLDGGDGYLVSSRTGREQSSGVWVDRVYAATEHAKRSNARHNTLLRSLNF